MGGFYGLMKSTVKKGGVPFLGRALSMRGGAEKVPLRRGGGQAFEGEYLSGEETYRLSQGGEWMINIGF